jgi:chromosomal replication initiation ATPase DnaA
MFMTTATRTAKQLGYTQSFFRQAQANRHQLSEAERRERIRLARIELRRQGLVRFKHWGMPEWARRIIEDVADRSGICPSEMAGPGRKRKVVDARNEAIYLIKDRKPMLSSPQMGRWFNRNHVSILYALASYSDAKGLPNLTYYDIDNSRTRKREAAAAKVAMRRMLKDA